MIYPIGQKLTLTKKNLVNKQEKDEQTIRKISKGHGQEKQMS